MYNLSDSQIIMEVMGSAPPDWATIINTQLCEDVVEFQGSIRYHKDSLMQLPSSYCSRFRNYTSNRDAAPISGQHSYFVEKQVEETFLPSEEICTFLGETRKEEPRTYPFPRDNQKEKLRR